MHLRDPVVEDAPLCPFPLPPPTLYSLNEIKKSRVKDVVLFYCSPYYCVNDDRRVPLMIGWLSFLFAEGP